MSELLTATAIEVAVSQLYVREHGGNNRGREVEEYLRLAGGQAGEPWCAAGLYWTFDKAAKKCGLVNPYPKTRSALAVWRHAEPITRDSNPGPGYVYVLQHSPATGHVGIIERIEDGVIIEISFNTNAEGSREGNAVARHRGQPEVTHGGVLLGYLDFSRAAQAPTVLTS